MIYQRELLKRIDSERIRTYISEENFDYELPLGIHLKDKYLRDLEQTI